MDPLRPKKDIHSRITKPDARRFDHRPEPSSGASRALVEYLRHGVKVTDFPKETTESDLHRIFAGTTITKINWISPSCCILMVGSMAQVDLLIKFGTSWPFFFDWKLIFSLSVIGRPPTSTSRTW